MFKLVVLSALLALVAAKPSGILSYSAPVVAAPVAVPAAVSHQYRTDVISKPVVATYAAPLVQRVVAPVVAPAVVEARVAPIALSSAITHQSRVDYHHPTVAVHAAPLAYAAHGYAAHGYAAHAPVVHAW